MTVANDVVNTPERKALRETVRRELASDERSGANDSAGE